AVCGRAPLIKLATPCLLVQRSETRNDGGIDFIVSDPPLCGFELLKPERQHIPTDCFAVRHILLHGVFPLHSSQVFDLPISAPNSPWRLPALSTSVDTYALRACARCDRYSGSNASPCAASD